MNKGKRYSPEVQERSVRLFLENRKDYRTRTAALESISGKIGCTPETLRRWVNQHEVDHGIRNGISSDERARMKALEKEKRELKRANEILKKASAFFAQAELDLNDEHRHLR